MDLEDVMSDKAKNPRHSKTENVDPAPWLGRVGDGATAPSGEYISREIRELTERAREHREEQERRNKNK
jgi:hypothetical protein